MIVRSAPRPADPGLFRKLARGPHHQHRGQTILVPWSLLGGRAAFLLHVPQDWLLLAGGVLTAALLLRRQRLQAGMQA